MKIVASELNKNPYRSALHLAENGFTLCGRNASDWFERKEFVNCTCKKCIEAETAKINEQIKIFQAFLFA